MTYIIRVVLVLALSLLAPSSLVPWCRAAPPTVISDGAAGGEAGAVVPLASVVWASDVGDVVLHRVVPTGHLLVPTR